MADAIAKVRHAAAITDTAMATATDAAQEGAHEDRVAYITRQMINIDGGLIMS